MNQRPAKRHARKLAVLTAACLVSLIGLDLEGGASIEGCSWKNVALPPLRQALLSDVDVVSEDDVWIVGEQRDRTLVLHYDGKSIIEIPSPDRFSLSDSLSGVAAITADDVWAVGTGVTRTKPNYVYAPFSLHYDGRRWRRVRVPSVSPPSQFGAKLVAVADSGPDDVWAVGVVDRGREWVGLIVHWDGTRWKTVHAPGNVTYSAVTSVASDNAWATGHSSIGMGASRWDGHQWLSVRDPQWRYGDGDWESVSASAPDNVWMVGKRPLAVKFDGRYLIDKSPPSSHREAHKRDSYLTDVIALAPNNVIAVGNFGIEHFDGRRWQPTSRRSPLWAVDAVSQHEIWAVGTDWRSRAWAVVLRYTCR